MCNSYKPKVVKRAAPRGRSSVGQVVHLTRVQQVLKLPEHSVENKHTHRLKGNSSDDVVVHEEPASS